MHMQTVVDGVFSLGSAEEGGQGGDLSYPGWVWCFDQDRLSSCILVVFRQQDVAGHLRISEPRPQDLGLEGRGGRERRGGPGPGGETPNPARLTLACRASGISEPRHQDLEGGGG